MRLDLADLRLFLHIVDAGSISKGAAEANLALASASERLRNMERDAGVTLLKRLPRGVVTTEAGDAVAHHARLMLQQQSILKSELNTFAIGARGTLNIYANTAVLMDFLPTRLAPWLKDRPQLQIRLHERTSDEIVKTITNGLGEAGIVSDAVNPKGLCMQPVAKDHLVLLVPDGHKFSGQQDIAFADVISESFVGLEPGSALQNHISQQAYTLGHILDFRIQVKTYEAIYQMVSQGVGVGIVPLQSARRYQRRYNCRVVRLKDKWARRSLCVCYREWEGLTAPMQSLLLHLLDKSES